MSIKQYGEPSNKHQKRERITTKQPHSMFMFRAAMQGLVLNHVLLQPQLNLSCRVLPAVGPIDLRFTFVVHNETAHDEVALIALYF